MKSRTEQGDDAHSTKAEAGIDHDLFGIRVGVGWREEISRKFEQKGRIAPARATF